MLSSNMVTIFDTNRVKIENSILGFWKKPGISKRLIRSGNRSKRLFQDKAKILELPIPEILGSLILEQQEDIFLLGFDLSQFYNILTTPEDVVPILGMLRIEAPAVGIESSSGFVIPCHTCIAMGISFRVALVQKVTITIIKDSNLPCQPLSVDFGSSATALTSYELPLYRRSQSSGHISRQD